MDLRTTYITPQKSLPKIREINPSHMQASPCTAGVSGHHKCCCSVLFALLGLVEHENPSPSLHRSLGTPLLSGTVFKTRFAINNLVASAALSQHPKPSSHLQTAVKKRATSIEFLNNWESSDVAIAQPPVTQSLTFGTLFKSIKTFYL